MTITEPTLDDLEERVGGLENHALRARGRDRRRTAAKIGVAILAGALTLIALAGDDGGKDPAELRLTGVEAEDTVTTAVAPTTAPPTAPSGPLTPSEAPAALEAAPSAPSASPAPTAAPTAPSSAEAPAAVEAATTTTGPPPAPPTTLHPSATTIPPATP